jgi:very-short-patch-repair endonuclease
VPLYRKGMTPVVRKLRRNMTDAERLLWSKLRRRQLGGACFYRQRIIGRFIVDFYCRKGGLIIELDGGQHFDGESKEKDRIRDAFFKERGLRVLRFDNHQVLKNTEVVLGEILRTVT